MVKINSTAFKTKIEAYIAPNVRHGFVELAKKRACWGIKDEGDLALIMGVLNFGDPDHRVPNTPNGRKAPIPRRPWLDRSAQGYYRFALKKYVEDNLPKVVAGIPKKGAYRSWSSQRALGIDDFVQGLAEVGADNARTSWDEGKFAPNTPATLRNKSDPRPLHDTGRMNANAIKAWSE